MIDGSRPSNRLDFLYPFESQPDLVIIGLPGVQRETWETLEARFMQCRRAVLRQSSGGRAAKPGRLLREFY